MSTRCKSNPNAFTIIEMVVVIALISLLMSFLLPALGMARTQARTVQGLSNLNQIAKSINIYALDNQNTLPLGYDNHLGNDTDWSTIIDGYLTDGTDTYEKNADNIDIFHCPNATYPNLGRSHYSAHPVLMPDISGDAPQYPLYKMARFRRPSEIVMVMDGSQRPPTDPTAPYTTFSTAWRLGEPDYVTVAPWFSKSNESNNDPIDPGPNNDNGGAANGTIRWRQLNDQAANFVFADTHAATINSGDLLRRNILID